MRTSANFRTVFSECQNVNPLDAELETHFNATARAIHCKLYSSLPVFNNWSAVAAQTARSRCKVLSILNVYYFRAYQRRTIHGVGVTTKLYFAVFLA